MVVGPFTASHGFQEKFVQKFVQSVPLFPFTEPQGSVPRSAGHTSDYRARSLEQSFIEYERLWLVNHNPAEIRMPRVE